MRKSFKTQLRRIIDSNELLYNCVCVLADEAVAQAPKSDACRHGTWTIAEAETFGLADALAEWLETLAPRGDQSSDQLRIAAFQFALESIGEDGWHEIADAYLERLRNKGD